MKKNVEKITIMDIPFVNNSLENFIDDSIRPCLENEKRCFIVTANPEIVMSTMKDQAYKHIVLRADYVVPDGIGVVLAAKFKRHPLTERIAGFDLMVQMLEMANDTHASCFFLGASEQANYQAVQNIQEKYANIQVAGRHHGYFDINDPDVVRKVKDSEPDFIFTALGFPKQEQWIATYLDEFSKGIFMGVGGSIDVFAGNVKRAPDFWIKWNLEWLYRLLKQPFRWKRMLPIVKFMWLVIRGKA